MSKKRLTDMEQLIKDYHRDNQRIQIMRIAWLPAEEILKGRGPEGKGKKMRKLPTRSQLMSTKDEPADGSQGDDHNNKPSTNDPIDPKSKKSDKSMNSSSSKTMSPARQIMKAVTSLALDPKRKSKSKSVATKGEKQAPGSKPKKAVAKAKSNVVDSDGDKD